MKIKGEIQTFNKSILLKSLNHDVENNYYRSRLNVSVTDTKILPSFSRQ